jgi:DNA-binding NarL/FixJ family response regulator
MKKPSKTTAARRGKHRIFLVDDHPVTREGLVRLINFEKDLEVCGQASSAARAIPEIELLKPDLAVIDVSLSRGPSGLELVKDLSQRDPQLKMLVLSTHDESLYAERALRAGAKGYVMKQEPMECVMTAIRQVLQGGIYLSDFMNTRLLHKMVHRGARATASEVEHLSDRELEIFRLLGQGYGTKQIASNLHLSISTVETHRTHIKEKLRLQTAPELVRRAVEWVQSQSS